MKLQLGLILGLAALIHSGSGLSLNANKRQAGGAPNEVSLERFERQAGGGTLQEFQQKFLQLFNQFRRNHNLPTVRLDPTLTRGAQSWAETEAQDLENKHSCDDCSQYAEVLARRRSSRKLPTGVEAAEWVYGSWFGEEDDSYDVISLNPNLHKIGVGVGYRRAPDRSYHAYAVGRFTS